MSISYLSKQFNSFCIIGDLNAARDIGPNFMTARDLKLSCTVFCFLFVLFLLDSSFV